MAVGVKKSKVEEKFLKLLESDPKKALIETAQS